MLDGRKIRIVRESIALHYPFLHVHREWKQWNSCIRSVVVAVMFERTMRTNGQSNWTQRRVHMHMLMHSRCDSDYLFFADAYEIQSRTPKYICTIVVHIIRRCDLFVRVWNIALSHCNWTEILFNMRAMNVPAKRYYDWNNNNNNNSNDD